MWIFCNHNCLRDLSIPDAELDSVEIRGERSRSSFLVVGYEFRGRPAFSVREEEISGEDSGPSPRDQVRTRGDAWGLTPGLENDNGTSHFLFAPEH